MEENEAKHIYTKKENCLLSPEYLDEIDQHYFMITGKDEKIAVHHFLMLCLEKAVSRLKPIKINEDLQSQVEKLKIEVLHLQEESNANGERATSLQLSLDACEEEIKFFKENEKPGPVEGAIILNFDEKQLSFINICLELYKREGLARTHEEMYFSIIKNFQGLGYLKITESDLKYIKELKQS